MNIRGKVMLGMIVLKCWWLLHRLQNLQAARWTPDKKEKMRLLAEKLVALIQPLATKVLDQLALSPIEKEFIERDFPLVWAAQENYFTEWDMGGSPERNAAETRMKTLIAETSAKLRGAGIDEKWQKHLELLFLYSRIDHWHIHGSEPESSPARRYYESLRHTGFLPQLLAACR